MRFVRASPEWGAAAGRFNQRLDDGKAKSPIRLPSVFSEQRSPEGSRRFRREWWLVVDGAEVRGGVLLQLQPCEIDGRRSIVANAQSPISEGLVSSEFAAVGVLLIKELLKLHPQTYAVGMGSTGNPLPRLLAAMRWQVFEVPFLFYPLNVRRFLLKLPKFRARGAIRWLTTIAAVSGLAPITITAGRHVWKRWQRHERLSETACQQVFSWEPWVDLVWAGRRKEAFGVRRTTSVLDRLLPLNDGRVLGFRVDRDGSPVGWLGIIVTQMAGNQHFGDLKLGTVVDCLSISGAEALTANKAIGAMKSLGVDLGIVNHSSPEWTEAFTSVGFFRGSSNYVAALSPALIRDPESVRITRADGDGRIHL